MLMCADCHKPLLSAIGWKLLDEQAASIFCSCTHVRGVYRIRERGIWRAHTPYATSAPKPQRTPVPAAFLTAFEGEDLDPGEQHASF